MINEIAATIAAAALVAPFVDGTRHPARFRRAKPVIQGVAAMISAFCAGYIFGFSDGPSAGDSGRENIAALVAIAAAVYVLALQLFDLYTSASTED